ncbi:MAG TPA: hypothetical protein VLR52_00550 [Bacteroidales bacterium]|nr:hypothetical protein [Bacteroidales bacterium]
MHRNILIFFLFSFLGISACDNTNTVVESTYPDQSPKVVKTYKGKGEDKVLVSQKSFYPGNKIQMEGAFKENQRDGKWTYWHSNGKPWSEGYFKDGKAEGKRTTYYESGQIYYEGYYKDDKRVGKWRFFDETGKMVKEVDFSKNGAAIIDTITTEPGNK